METMLNECGLGRVAGPLAALAQESVLLTAAAKEENANLPRAGTCEVWQAHQFPGFEIEGFWAKAEDRSRGG